MSLSRNIYDFSLQRNQWYPQTISLRELGNFNRVVEQLPKGTSFDKACSKYGIDRFFVESSETRAEIKDLYEQALRYSRPPRKLTKSKNRGRFLKTCTIRGVKFKDALCDSGSCINMMSSRDAEKIGLKDLQASDIRIGFANCLSIVPMGMVSNICVKIGSCDIPTDFQVEKLHNSY